MAEINVMIEKNDLIGRDMIDGPRKTTIFIDDDDTNKLSDVCKMEFSANLKLPATLISFSINGREWTGTPAQLAVHLELF